MNHSSVAAALAGIAVVLSCTVARAEADQDRTPQKAVEASEDDPEAFRIGAVGGVGFPRPLAVEGMVKLGGVVALGGEYSVLPRTSISGVQLTSWALAADARVFPFKGAFFIGLRAGHQVFAAHTTVTAAGVSQSESATAETWFVNPRLGFLWTWQSGFTLGIDAGVQLPIGATVSSTLPGEAPSSINTTFGKVAGVLGNDVTPTVDLLRIGFLF